jgi:hypothetical protein
MGADRAAGTLSQYAVVLAAKAAIGACAWLGGFRAISDDDFARVVLAQRWALEPALDPTGTSWLPLPFWVYGACLKLFGSTLSLARGTAFLIGLASAALLLAAARLLIRDRRAALWGALLAACFPYGAWLGVATVPEWPTAALTLFAIASLESDRGSTRCWGALALFAACLCRYEPWMVAPWFALVCLHDARKAKLEPALAWLSAALAVGAPLCWMAHNHLSHGDALHFVARVSAYRRALAGGGGAAGSYALDLLRKEPELMALAAALVVAMPRCLRAVALRRRALLIALAVFVSLSLSAAWGASATHHPERSLLLMWLLLAIGTGAGMRQALRSPRRARFAALTLLALPLAALVLRPWFARIEGFASRSDELALGAILHERQGGERVLLEVSDYGFYALQAASGRPQQFELDRSIDPRKPKQASSFAARRTMLERCRAAGAQSAVGRERVGLVHASDVRARAGDLAWWRCR